MGERKKKEDRQLGIPGTWYRTGLGQKERKKKKSRKIRKTEKD